MIKRQMYGRVGFTLLRHRILLGLSHIRSPPKVRQSRCSYSPFPGGELVKGDLGAGEGLLMGSRACRPVEADQMDGHPPRSAGQTRMASVSVRGRTCVRLRSVRTHSGQGRIFT
jgi:hypothetical protein